MPLLALEKYSIGVGDRFVQQAEAQLRACLLAPSRAQVQQWSSSRFVAAIEHDRRNPNYSPQMRQLLHVAYKVAAEMGGDYLGALQKHRSVIGQRVTANFYEKHIK